MAMVPTDMSEDGLRLLMDFERCKLAVYDDGYGFQTIGWGHLWTKGMPTHISQQVADELLVKDLVPVVQKVRAYLVENCRKDITQSQFDAMCVFTYNVGIGGFLKSEVLRNTVKGDFAVARNSFKNFVRSNGKVSRGLQIRRECEALMYEGKPLDYILKARTKMESLH